MAKWSIEKLDSAHERSDFACGQRSLDEFIRLYASQFEKRRLGRTFVAVQEGSKRVIGYYTLAAGTIAFPNVPPEISRRLPKHPVPVILLARLAVDQTMQGNGIGEDLLLDGLHRAVVLSVQLGIHAVEVEALDNQAADFYKRYGFIRLPDTPSRLFLPIETIRKSLEG